MLRRRAYPFYLRVLLFLSQRHQFPHTFVICSYMFRIIGEFVEGFDKLSGIGPAVTIYGSARLGTDSGLYAQTEEIAYRLGQLGFSIITGGGPGVMEAGNKGAQRAGVTSVGLNIVLPEEQGR